MKEGRGITIKGLRASGLWTFLEASLSIKVLELRAIRLGLQRFEEELLNKMVVIMSDLMSTISYIHKEGVTRSVALN